MRVCAEWGCGQQCGHYLLFYVEEKSLWMCSELAEHSTVILRSAVQNDLMLRNRQVSRVRAEMLWQHFLHADKDLPSFRSSPGKQSERVPPAHSTRLEKRHRSHIVRTHSFTSFMKEATFALSFSSHFPSTISLNSSFFHHTQPVKF